MTNEAVGRGMIINLRGTSGTGKTTAMRAVMSHYENRIKYYEEGRKQPIGYRLLKRDGSLPPLAVVGHYETDCGGCDTINLMDHVMDLVRLASDSGDCVMFEGLLLSQDFKRTLPLWQDGYPVHVIGIELPLEEALASVNERRKQADLRRIEKVEAENAVLAEQGRKLKPVPEMRGGVNPKNTINKYSSTASAIRRLGEAGVPTEMLPRDKVEERCIELLKSQVV